MTAPLKAKSLSELRNLQRQADAQTKTAQGDHAAPDHNRATSGDPMVQPVSGKRRPHRFLPPGPDAAKTRPAHPEPVASSARSSTETVTQAPGSTETAAAPSPRPQGHPPPSERFVTAPTAEARPETLAPEDIALFRRVVQGVTPAAHSNRAVLPPVPAAAPAQLRQRRQHAAGQRAQGALDVSDHYTPAGIDHDDTVFLQTGQGPHLIKGLKKGKWQIQANLDLHGANLDEARERMDRFIQSCRDHQVRCVRIVHGKGYGSKNGDAVLKETVRRWLSQLAVVQAYIECDEADGGAGAVLVLLAKQKT